MLEWLNTMWLTPLIVAGLLIAALVIIAHLFLHVRPTALASPEALAARLNRGRPTLLYFYSNF